MTEMIFRFTPEELEVLQSLIGFFYDVGIPDGVDQESYDSLFNKVMSN
jgi:hypothetical protein